MFTVLSNIFCFKYAELRKNVGLTEGYEISLKTRSCKAHYVHANGELKWSSSYSHFSLSATILLVVWSAKGDGSALTTSQSR